MALMAAMGDRVLKDGPGGLIGAPPISQAVTCHCRQGVLVWAIAGHRCGHAFTIANGAGKAIRLSVR
jgi:hypothetical protein